MWPRLTGFVVLFVSIFLGSAHAQTMSIQEFDAMAKEEMCTAPENVRASSLQSPAWRNFVRRVQAASAPPCLDVEDRIGYYKFDHCRLHKHYQVVFPQAGCSCSTGQCRPTNWRNVALSETNDSGIEIYLSGTWYAVPQRILHKFYSSTGFNSTGQKMPVPLLEYDAHVCAYEPTAYSLNVTIECVWVRAPG